MKEILDFVILALFIFMLAMFVINFNRQQIKKHTDRLEENEKKENQNKEEKDA
ncbi:hypothetical protein AAX26_01372 [Aliarcobacter thereius]|uniref:Small hydrophobic protein n=1 Tax=Aliarcobacter thereius LMG 24486 TaxID=1032240 RepID=A0A1C7WSN7_9BACT|nr:hypothetical protein [Aliarcobacter thereius]OCL87064.1 hypothetical protein AAX26_01372 [Aliarcobacter thereius]OCL91247.1 hypothetical protein AAX25_01417 [Aliarcobacter thereius]OCL95915.1 hypothetical protein AA347_01404 [Aliarcobacter thereius LMG 24486]QBF16112.1 hypothetical protein ATH_1046 [Aliarcobacter thereius LMG 24486]